MPQSRQRFLKPEVLSKLATMGLRARTLVEGVMTGLHRSPFRGLSIEFAEYRQYQPGNDPVFIDWKVYARSDRYYIKEFEDETNLDAYIILDASASMGFGSNSLTKWQYGGILAASLAYILQQQNDEIGLVILDETIRFEIQPKGTRGHLIHIISEMEKTAPSRQTRLADALHYVAGKIKRKGMAIVISDLLDNQEEVISGLRHIQFGGNEVIVFQVIDPVELSFNFEGPMLFIDPETKTQVPALTEEIKNDYLKSIEEFIETYSRELGKTNISHIVNDTSEPFDRSLLEFLCRR